MTIHSTSSHTDSPTPRRRRGALVTGGAVLAAALVLAAPLAASAHVGVTPGDASAGTSTVLTFSFSHGCDDSPTTALVFDVPEGVESVTPTLTAGWTVTTEQGANESISQVTYAADAPVPSGIRATLDLSVRFAADAAETSVAFPVTQICEVGETAWTEVAEEGVDPETLEAPAPVVAVGAVSTEGEHGHGGTEASTDDHSEHGDASSGSDSTGVAPIVLGSLGLALGAVALVVSVLAFRRTRTGG